jgi:hypothetical protein
MDCLSRCIHYKKLIDEIKISGKEHLKVILQDPQTYLKKAEEIRNEISSDQYLPSYEKENFLKEVNYYIEEVKQTAGKNSNLNVTSLIGCFIAFGLGYYLGYNKKSEEILEKQQLMSDALVALKNELKKYL